MKHKASSILAIVLVIAGCVLRFAMPEIGRAHV